MVYVSFDIFHLKLSSRYNRNAQPSLKIFNLAECEDVLMADADVVISDVKVNVPCRCGIWVQSRSVINDRNFSGVIDLSETQHLNALSALK